MGSIKNIKSTADQIRRRSKRLLAYTAMTLAASAMATKVRAQTAAEWFSQGSTQKKYLLQQLAYLKLLNSTIKLGNNISANGLGSIAGSLKTENIAHAAYYNKLKMVSPLVKDNPQVAEITGWQKDILKRMKGLELTANLNPNEQQYVLQVKTALFNDCSKQIAQLQNLITDGKLQMNDAERLKQLGLIHTEMLDNYCFASSFAGQVKVLAAERIQENNNALITGKIYGIQ